jgi:hypothetical protein|tara:strand:- start:2863 stop:3060 length:198 start_codon:yes stop_codon:yes gene_type:complete
MKKLIKNVLDNYNTGRKRVSNEDLANLIVAHINVGIDGKKGWYLDMSDLDGKYNRSKEMIKEFGG